MKPLISIIIPIYNVEKYLNKCLNSIINQTYDKLEIILVNDGSLDKCGVICDEYAKNDNRIQVIHKENGGLSSARNVALDIANGEYVLFVDSDDWIDKDTCKNIIEVAINEQADIVQFGFRTVDQYGNIKKEKKSINFVADENQNILELFFAKNVIEVMVWNKLYKRDLFNTIRMIEGKNNEDTMLMPELMLITEKFINVDQIYYNYLKREDSIMSKNFNIKKLDSIFACNYVINLCDKKIPKYKNYMHIILCMVCIYLFNDLKNSVLSDNKEFNSKIINTFNENYKLIKNSKEFKATKIKNKILINIFSINKNFTVLLYRIYTKIKGLG